ncbi:hypothetical protein G7Y89_g11137 [Cudoniella acicularis]|uniref:HNH nuclease domain-containing protein n=1 Tax=Cudoniella acicularis TaxID=354080 RepID=A0A8H4RBE2_9HELO|nr:hypothetical protein G7Y89_g11137 [Cudoniella acicularis]
MDRNMIGNPESEKEAPNWEELQESSIGAESPELYPSPSVVAGDGLFAILGHDLSLLRLYNVAPESAKCIQGYHSSLDSNPNSPERMRQLFWQGQSNSKNTFDWGLRLNLKFKDEITDPGLITKLSKHGFVDCKWPSQKVRTDNPAGHGSRMYQKATTYVQNGRLIQAISIVCDDNSDISFSWGIGGEVQMWNESNDPSRVDLPPITPSDIHYNVHVSKLQSGEKEIPVLTMEGESHFNSPQGFTFIEEIMCMDVAVFLNREPQSLGDDTVTETQKSVNFSRKSGEHPMKLIPRKGQCLVAVFSLREKSQTLKAETMSCPSWSELRGRLGIKRSGEEKIQPTGSSLPSLNAALVERTGISQLDAMPDIITRVVEQLCSIAIRFELEADDSIYNDFDSLSSTEPAQTAAGVQDHETGGQSVVSIVNNLAIGPVTCQLTHEPYFWHIRLLAQILTILKPETGQGQDPSESAGNAKDVNGIISGSISRYLSLLMEKENLVGSNFDLLKEVVEIQAFLVMSLFSARSCVDLESLPQENMEGWILPIQIETVPGEESFDAVFRLLQWCHRKILMDERFKELFSEKPWLQNYLDANRDRLSLELERYRDGALRPLPMPSEIDILSGSGDAADVFPQLAREEQWMRLALLQVEIFAEDTLLRPFLSKLVDQVSKRLKRRATSSVGYLPPWGYRCLDHLLEMDWAVAKKTLGYSWEDLQNKIQSSYENCRYFLKSDLSFFKSRDTADPSWIQGHWDMDLSSSVCSSFLQAAKLLQEDPDSAHNPGTTLGSLDLATMSLMMSSIEAAHDVLHPLQKNSGFPWKQNLADRAHHPQFMCTSLRIRDGARDKKRLKGRIKALKNQDKTNPLVSDKVSAFRNLANNVPDVWSAGNLDIKDGEVQIVDFPLGMEFHSEAKVLDLFEENRVDRGAAYRIIAVNILERPGLVNTYLHFAHEDAWDAVVDYFGSASLFRGFSDILHEDTKELSWRMSINIAHIIIDPRKGMNINDQLPDLWEPPKHEIPEEYDKEKRVFRDVCSTICTTGDRLGEFWTCSFLGPFSTLEKGQNNTSQSPAQNGHGLQGPGQQPRQAETRPTGEEQGHKPSLVFDVDKVTKINERYKFDKYSARNLVFVIQLSRLIWILSGLYEDVAQYLESIMKLDASERLYEQIASPEFAKSGAEKATGVTDTLRRVLWGIEWLQKLEWSIKAAELAINEAINYVERNLSKRRQYWHPKLEEFEQEQVWGENRRAQSRMKAFRNRVETIDRRATGIKDNLISLTNMSSTKAILTTTADTSRMKIISILTAVFLPFTVVAVVLTIPMFEWPKAEEGEILVPLPFKIFWATSLPLAAIIGFLMWLISEGEKRDWKLPPLKSSGLPNPAHAGQPPGNHGGGSGSQGPNHLKNSSSNANGGAVGGLPPGTLPSGSVDEAGTIANGNGGAIQRFLRRSRRTDIENVSVEPQQGERSIKASGFRNLLDYTCLEKLQIWRSLKYNLRRGNKCHFSALVLGFGILFVAHTTNFTFLSHIAFQTMPPSQQPLLTDEDCNLPGRERLSLLECLQVSLGDVPPHFWAACHLSDLQELALLVQTAELNPNIVCIAAGQTYSMVASWNQSIPGSASAATTPRSSPIVQRTQSSLAGPFLSPSQGSPYDANTPPTKRQKTSFTRSKTARDSAKIRDNYRCVLTGTGAVEVAHIYPFCLLAEEDEIFGKRHVFWRMLRNFWSKEKIAAWEAAVFPDGPEERGLETARNLITLSADAHILWNKGAFALKPISLSEDNATLTIQFFWQVRQPLVMPTINLTTTPLSTRDLESNGKTRLANCRQPEVRIIKSGDLFELTTDDPETKPLPSMALLEMQWFLQRVMGMAGAADELQDSEYHFSDNGLYNWGLEKGGDDSFLSNAGLSDSVIPDDTNVLPSIETPARDTEDTEEMDERPGDRVII